MTSVLPQRDFDRRLLINHAHNLGFEKSWRESKYPSFNLKGHNAWEDATIGFLHILPPLLPRTVTSTNV